MLQMRKSGLKTKRLNLMPNIAQRSFSSCCFLLRHIDVRVQYRPRNERLQACGNVVSAGPLSMRNKYICIYIYISYTYMYI